MNIPFKPNVLAHSTSVYGQELISVILPFPTVKLAELRTHRILSQHEGEVIITASNDIGLSLNANSSRAIPGEKQLEMVRNKPYYPIWTKSKKGMQGTVITDFEDLQYLDKQWYQTMNENLDTVNLLLRHNVHKQDASLLLNPYSWTTCVITATKDAWDHFFELRCPKYSTPVSGEGFYAKSKRELISWHSNQSNLDMLEDPNFDWNSINSSMTYPAVQYVAELLYDAVHESKPRFLKPGEWHVIFNNSSLPIEHNLAQSMSKCALISYDNQYKDEDIIEHINRARRLISSGHWSTAEHQARVPHTEELKHFSTGFIGVKYVKGKYHSNTPGWIRLRELITNSEITI